MNKLELEVISREGIHARPSSRLYKIFNKIKETYNVNAYIDNNGEHCTTILEILSLGKTQGEIVHLVFDGDKYQEAKNYFLKETRKYLAELSRI